MKTLRNWPASLAFAAAGILGGCSHSSQAPEVAGNVRKALDDAGLKRVSVSQDRDKGVVTLGGHVENLIDKTHAETIAQSMAAGQVVSDQIAVEPPGAVREARAVNSDLDKGIESNLDAVLILNKLHDSVKYAVKNGVVTLTGDVDSQTKRRDAEQIAAGVPNVHQVVNELQVKNQKATSSE